LLISIGDLVKVVVISALLAYIIDPLAVFLESRGMSRRSATVIMFVSMVFCVAIGLFLLLPVLSGEIMAIRDGLDSTQATSMVSKIEEGLKNRFSFFGIRNLDLVNKTHGAMVSIGDWMFSHLLDMVSLVTDMVIIPFIVFFLLKDGRELKKQLISMVPNRYFEFSLNMLYKMDLQLGNYLRGQFLDAVIFGIMSVFSLWLLNVKYFVAIGVFAGLANLIPFLGPVAGAAPAMIVSVIDTGSLIPAIYVLLAFVAMKLIDDSLIQPLVVARSVDMHPLLVLLAIIIGGKLFGILGMLVAVPVTGFLKVILREGVVNFRKYHWA
jgi:putative permease